MKFLTSKYQSKLSTLFLTIYSFLLFVGIFHCHHYNFSNSAFVDSGKDNFSNHLQVVTGNNYECIIQQNLTSLQTTLISVLNDHQVITDEKLFFQNSSSQSYVIQVHLNDNLLRAPPALS